jgi:hypothetical protein
VSFFRVLLIFALGGAVALGAQYALREQDAIQAPRSQQEPTISTNLPGSPTDPPVVWLEGVIEELDASSLALREGEGPTIDIRRFEEGATDFLRLVNGTWREVPDGEVEGVAAGGQACVETLLDGRTFFALRIFLGARCGPA